MQLGGPECLVHGDADGVELVIACHLFDERAAAVVLKDGEVAQEVEEIVGCEDARQHHLQFGHVRVGQILAGDGAPWLEPLACLR